MTVLVTGATGRAGRHVARILRAGGHPVRAAANEPGATGPWDEAVPFSFTNRGTWDAAFAGVDRMFLMRPPQIGNVKRDMLPALERARQLGVRRVVLLSLQGAERNPVVPHHALEKWLRGSGLEWTFVRPGFFMQNLSTTHAADIRDRDEIVLPAGDGRTSFVDVRDVAAVAALALTEAGHAGRAYTPTGSRALGYGEAAELLTAELGRPIRYVPVGPLRYWRSARGQGMPAGMTLVTLALHTTCRLGLAAGVTTDVRDLLGRPPIGFAQFVHDERAAWLRVPGSVGDRPATATDGRRPTARNGG
ncbi:NmrA family NAD(P)-binding protein [Micromonospora sp. CPCC 205556]|uniref:NmrA family NAD(P)-binding protein n=1 Tax=Micromonospora sp. CPCC 205556 TaxID=3122398 RepID=UPI002FEFAC64